MGIFKNESNIVSLFEQQHTQEMEENVKLNLGALREGRQEDYLLLQALRGNWSVEQFVKVAKQRGKSWRFLSAMADKANELQGITMLYFMGEVAQYSFVDLTMQKILLELERMDSFTRAYMERTGTHDDPIVNQIIEDARVHLMTNVSASRSRFTQRIQRLLED